jgi:signal transduction histidine kinase
MTGTSTDPAPPAAELGVPGDAAVVGSASAATERALRIVALVWSAAWIPLLALVGDASLSKAPALTRAMIALLAVGWVLALLDRIRIAGTFVALVAGTAVVQALLTPPVGLWTGDGLLIVWTNLAAISCGLLVAGRRGRVAVAAIAGTQLLILVARAASEGTLHLAWSGLLAFAAYALADGMAAHVAASALRGQARRSDAAAAELADERGRRAVREALVQDGERVSRTLHDTVLNTLGALRRGIDPGDVEATRARCADDLVELKRLRDTRLEVTGDTGVRVEAVQRALIARAGLLSVEVTVRDRITSTTPLPTAVADAALGACAEALLNVAKHSGVRSAQVELAWDGERLDASVQDDGCGWTGAVLPGHGVAGSILGRARDAGIEALVATAPGAGTTVSLTWRAPAEPSVDAAAADDADVSGTAAARVLAAVAVRAGGWLTGLLVFLTLVFWGDTDPRLALVALAILALVLLLAWQVGVRRGEVPLRAPLALLLVAAVFVVSALPGRDALTCDQLLEGWWGLDGAMVVMLSLVLLTRGWWWAAAGTAAMVLGALSLYLRDVPLPAECADIPAVNAALELSIVVAFVFFREALLRQWQRAAEGRARSDALRISAEVAQATAAARDARIHAVIDTTVPLLDTIARGQVDPTDVDVRRRSAVLESALRSLLALGPAHDPLSALVADAVSDAYLRGAVLEVLRPSGEVALPGEAAVEPLRALLREVVGGLRPEQVVTAALIRGPEGSSLTLVSDASLPPLPVALGRDLAAVGLLLDQAEVGEQSLVEVRWP